MNRHTDIISNDSLLVALTPGLVSIHDITDLCKLPFPDGTASNGQYKWPKLTELHEFLFGESFTGAHDALTDVKATARCFWELYKRRLI